LSEASMRGLTPSTPFTYRPVVPGIFASFRVLKFGVFPAQGDFRGGFDSQQLHKNMLIGWGTCLARRCSLPLRVMRIICVESARASTPITGIDAYKDSPEPLWENDIARRNA